MTKPSDDTMREAFESLETTINDLITCQREEQEAILNRNPAMLPIISGKIDSLYGKLEKLLDAVNHLITPEQKDLFADQRANCQGKLELLSELSLQNHLLLENSLCYLESIFKEVLGSSENVVYNQLGLIPGGFAPSGSLLDIKA
ncbi:MAG: hypothetical protein AAF984_09445 [Verrucomicrobiota bacterium]